MKPLFCALFFLCSSIISYSQYISNSSRSAFDNGSLPSAISFDIQKNGEKQPYTETIIDGKPVAGFPYIFYDWVMGSILLKDGKYYNGYKLKYDIYGQTILFLDGNKTLEVEGGDVKEFTLTSKDGKEMNFINANNLKKGRASLYYQILADAKGGLLLKSYRKVIAKTINQIVDVQSTKYLEIETKFLYFNKNEKKLSSLNGEQDLLKAFDINKEKAEELRISNYQFEKEADLVAFFNTFFKS